MTTTRTAIMVADQEFDIDHSKFHSVFSDTRRTLHDYVIVGVKTD
jgi:hypothetical protein